MGSVMNLGILNTVIAFVIVLLVLSLLVQAIQMFLKKLLKLKSKQIIASLEDLYDQALSATSDSPAADQATMTITPGASLAKQCREKIVVEAKKDPVVQAIESFFGQVKRLRSGQPAKEPNDSKRLTDKIMGEF